MAALVRAMQETLMQPQIITNVLAYSTGARSFLNRYKKSALDRTAQDCKIFLSLAAPNTNSKHTEVESLSVFVLFFPAPITRKIIDLGCCD